MTTNAATIAGAVLAGGRSSRMNGRDKAALPLAGKSLLEHAVERLEPQVSALAVNSNAAPANLPIKNLPVINDTIPDYAGPLAGILASLEWAISQNAAYLATVACDTPFFPQTLVATLRAALSSRDSIALATSGGRVHPVFALWTISIADDLRAYLETDKRRSVLAYAERHNYIAVDFEIGPDLLDPFLNINTPLDLEEAECIAHKIS